MMLFSLHHGHMPAEGNGLLNHIRGLRQASMQNLESSATMRKRNCKGPCSSTSDAGGSQSDSQVTTGRNGVEGSASGCISSDSPDDSEVSDQSKAKSEHNTAEDTDMQSLAAKNQQALYQDLDAILCTNSNAAMLRRKVEQASLSATYPGIICLPACFVEVPVRIVNAGYTCRASCRLSFILPANAQWIHGVLCKTRWRCALSLPSHAQGLLLVQVLSSSTASQHVQRKAAGLSSASLASPAEPSNGWSARQRAEVPMALLCSLSGREMLLLLVDCPSVEDQTALSSHPAVKQLAEHPVEYAPDSSAH